MRYLGKIFVKRTLDFRPLCKKKETVIFESLGQQNLNLQSESELQTL